MNGGLIAGRYAKAFYTFTQKEKASEAVYAQVRILLGAMDSVPRLREVLQDERSAPADERIALMRQAVAGQQLCPQIADFYRLLDSRSRTENFQLALLDYTDLYCAEHSILPVKLTVARENPALVALVERNVKKDFGMQALVDCKVDPEIIGGFVVRSREQRLDLSAKASLERIRKQLTIDSKRSV